MRAIYLVGGAASNVVRSRPLSRAPAARAVLLPESFRGGCSFGAGVAAGLSRASSWAGDTFARHDDGVKGLASRRYLARGQADTKI
jgi:hypothetical protein